MSGGKKRPAGEGRPFKKRKFHKKPVKEGSNEEVLIADIKHFLKTLQPQDVPTSSSGTEVKELAKPFTEVDVQIATISSTGDGLGTSQSSDQAYVVPFSAPGDTVRAKVIKHFPQEQYTLADFLHVVKPSPLRDDSRSRCPYFASCGGCQFQMLAYPTQLAHKKTVVEKAYRNFSGLAQHLVPPVEDIIGSPLQYGYRTKLTPHFDRPRQGRGQADKDDELRKRWEKVPPIGFMKKGLRKTIDIEDCPIGTDAVRNGMRRERTKVAENIETYKRGATILLRESTDRILRTANGSSEEKIVDSRLGSNAPEDIIDTSSPTRIDHKTCITDSNATSTEYIDDLKLFNPAGAFFQNNNSILPIFTSYIRSHILPPTNTASASITNLIDAYCGSGLFSISLASLFKSTTGIDISPSSIDYARRNAISNNIPNAKFIAADATALFREVTYPPDETVVVIDPPRKGCDASFLEQLMDFGPKRVVYVSCNVHTQARDLGVLVGGEKVPELEGHGKSHYEIERLGGFDFFPQTSHVEGVAILSRLDGGKDTIKE
ncbi:MAG: tRNA(m5U54)methyltransferase [Sclerophora amabilis]|nr:MAG: tRNA(m5U54)methyltransferase [Sclerophora amabilis]